MYIHVLLREIIWPLNPKERHLLYLIHAVTTVDPVASRHEARSHTNSTASFCTTLTAAAVRRPLLLAPPIPPEH